MGGVNSCWLPRYQNPNVCRENHTSTPKIKGHKRNLSAAFNIAAMEAPDMTIEQLNINTATEEELMTLPGINRMTAHNIVEYRRQIDGFKRVEDLALVSGVGATKLNQIRVEICVGRKKSSQSSSRSSSRNDLSMLDNVSKSSGRSHVRISGAYFPKIMQINLNSSNVFQLMKVKGISQNIGENIVAYRDKKGPYKSIDDLVKVKGITPGILSAVRPYLVLKDDEISILNGNTPIHTAEVAPVSSGVGTHGHGVYGHTRTQSYTNGIVLQNGSAPVTTVPMGSQDDLLNMYGPIARKSFRQRVPPVILKRNNRSVLRLAAWNLHKCTRQKAENPGVKEVVCMTILENGWSIVAIQDITEAEALRELCGELNRPTTPNVKKWAGPRGCWNYVVSPSITSNKDGGEYLGFLYDTSREISLTSQGLINVRDAKGNPIDRSPFACVFKVGSLELISVNIHLRSEGTSHSSHLIRSLSSNFTGDANNCVLLGDLTHTADVAVGEMVQKAGYQSTAFEELSPSQPPVCQTSTNIWLNGASNALYTGHYGVVKEGLTSPWIPDGWSWGGPVSPHEPVWNEIYTTPLPIRENSLTRSLEMIKLAVPLAGAGDA